MNNNDNHTSEPRTDLRDYAIDSTMERLESVSNMSHPERKKDEVVIGSRSLAQFLGIEDDSLKRQLFDQTAMEQNFITERYIERLRSSGSLADAGRDMANCLTYGTDYDLKLSNAPRMRFAPAIPTPNLGMGGGINMGTPTPMPPLKPNYPFPSPESNSTINKDKDK